MRRRIFASKHKYRKRTLMGAPDEYHPDAHDDATEITGERKYGEWGQCIATAKSTGDRCKGYAKGPNGKCRSHGGDTPTADENENVGNGDQSGNQNAMKTGIHSDPVDLFDWLADNDPEAAAWIMQKLDDYAEHTPREVFRVDVTDVDSFDEAEAALTAYGDDLLLLCTRDYARWRGTKKQLKEGLITTQTQTTESGPVQVTDSNPVNLDLDRLDRTSIQQKDKLGVLPDDSADVEVNVHEEMMAGLKEVYDEN